MAGEIEQLLRKNPSGIGKLTRAISNVVAKSFAADKARVTQSETRRRGQICIEAARVCLGDSKLSLERTIACLPDALRSKLDGGNWMPPKRAMFAVDSDDPLLRAVKAEQRERLRRGIA